jgi:predicted dehydrogenase
MIRIGIIGAGNMGSGHTNWITEGRVPGMTVSAVADRLPEKRDWARNRVPDAAVFEEGTALIASGACDAVIIATPHYQHPALTSCAKNPPGSTPSRFVK